MSVKLRDLVDGKDHFADDYDYDNNGDYDDDDNADDDGDEGSTDCSVC